MLCATAFAFMPLLILFCCGVFSSDVQCLSMGRTTPKNCPFTWGIPDLDPHLIHGSFGPPESPPNGISRLESLDQFIRFCTVHECDQQTHTGRDHATPLSVVIDRIYAMHAMRPKNKERNLAVANSVLAHTTHVVGSKSNFAWR